MKRLFAPILTVFVLLGCGKEKLAVEEFSPSSKPESVLVVGTVYFWGEPAVDGCGWVIAIGNDYNLSGAKLPESLKQDSLKVEVKYKDLGTTNCGMNPNGLIDIEILQIKKNS